MLRQKVGGINSANTETLQITIGTIFFCKHKPFHAAQHTMHFFNSHNAFDPITETKESTPEA